MSGLDVLGAFAALAVVAGGLGAMFKVMRVIGRIGQLLEAQLTPNGGGSLVDKVNKIPHLQTTIDRNHEEAMTQWKTLHLADEEISRQLARGDERFRAIEKRIEEVAR